jgi:hypothetical protein
MARGTALISFLPMAKLLERGGGLHDLHCDGSYEGDAVPPGQGESCKLRATVNYTCVCTQPFTMTQNYCQAESALRSTQAVSLADIPPPL